MSYEVVFKTDNGKTFVFGPKGGNYFYMSFADGVDVDLGKSQGFAQIGETVQEQSVGGRTIDVSGQFFGDIATGKNAMRNVCFPLATGTLTFNGKHYAQVYVKKAPSFAPYKNNGLFKMQFYAPYPFFLESGESHTAIGGITRMYRLPINFSEPHYFGVKSSDRYTNIYNAGDVRVPLKMDIRSTGVVVNPVITNIQTFQFLKLNGTLDAGEYVSIYRDRLNVLRAEKHSGQDVEDVISWIDEESSLFELDTGDNLILANDDGGGVALQVSITFSPAVAVLYEY